ncbi:flagellar hook-associated protein 3 FlgL [Aidingimonas halophila]|uniref:Flagellar hook-associated protein 3 FlgL n=2 Tax=Aidingimonas halophila TaxID=574349 RepID=A0A1H3B938_9GAMM|nr:flagellar hook-associated protein FlgL [Aidingimonas halophila]SDX38305.1 flagellar hook-associated protein 3 FlgL [Aidingimonas halophila]
MMRISSVTMFEQGMSSMNRQQSEFMQVGQQIASGRKVVNPSDDPQAASRAVGVSQSLAVTEQYADARVSARNSLSQEESVLDSVSDAISSAKTLIVQAGNDTLSDADRESVSSELKGIYETLIGQANSTDGNGRYLFGGYQESDPPYVSSDGEVRYVGDDQVKEQQIDASRKMPSGDSGDAVFNSVPNGAGYVARADDGNIGDVTFKGPNRVDATADGYGEAYDVEFYEDGGEMRVEVLDEAGDPMELNETGDTSLAYSSLENGDVPLSFAGLEMTFKGDAPGDGDSFHVAPAEEGNTNLFRSMEDAIAALENENQTPADDAALRNTLSSVSRELDNSLDNVLTVRASVGARINELDVVDAVGDNRTLSYENNMSELVDLDYAEAISEYSLAQVGLQASQKAFADINSLSLFDQI